MQLEMPMRIHMVERQSGRPIGLKLRRDFLADLTLQRRV